ncbi:bifunctional phosphoglucose/phosphomannose isomerase [Picrophilus oshimae]|uniref:Bifunctional phosphoglucose/phosphomannose isomerase n=1 Tax=Picrophilus torridus (strain ATCC 700027 / DSM 9790 / JCM 10055 / NBRC 100828 / KAW 2/3) TaxID=1122961 RepID=Q6KZP1_PICTO|nr:bifunctional phosphoglucose/phosphomannose isomerase [Picrophilus oshimae]AAT43811.1 glucose/mannose-6-phosphate isomerase [Picrophilus oshimae DSM 9789]SMD31121.1 bifunctional phosphoglucose/phosphomannose isomerase [Picrophilus oshimae DSM 9789]
MAFINEIKSLKDQIKFDKRFDINYDFDNIVISGMGGSGIAGRIFQECYTKKPVFSISDYDIPDFVNDRTLFIAMSYSGNTEETISTVEQAMKRNANIFAVTSGGKLASIVKDYIEIPGGMQPRSALGYMIMPLFNTFLDISDDDKNNAYNTLNNMDQNHDDIRKEAYKIYENSYMPVIYGSAPYSWVAYRWKTQFNENSKILAYSNYFPELNHNDTMALKNTYRKERFVFYVLGSSRPRIKQRINITKEITDTEFNIIDIDSDNYLEKLFYLIHYGDYISYELAMIRNIDPMDVSTIEELKKRLD